MSPLQVFLLALEERLNSEGEHKGSFVTKQNIELCSFKAYKRFTQQVWLIDGNYKKIITKVEYTAKVVTEEEKNSALNTLYHLAITEVLKYYGI